MILTENDHNISMRHEYSTSSAIMFLTDGWCFENKNVQILKIRKAYPHLT